MNLETHTPDPAPMTLEGIAVHLFRCEHCGRDNELYLLSGEEKFTCQRCEKKSMMNRPIDRKPSGGFPFGLVPRQQSIFDIFEQTGNIIFNTAGSGGNISWQAEFEQDEQAIRNVFRSTGNIPFSSGDLTGNTSRAVQSASSLITLHIRNTDSVAHEIALFGANRLILTPNFGFPEQVKMDMGNQSYAQILFESQQRPFEISGFRFSSNDPAQLGQIVSVTRFDSIAGSESRVPIFLMDLRNIFYQQAGNMVEAQMQIQVDGNTEFNFRLLPSAIVMFSLFVTRRA